MKLHRILVVAFLMLSGHAYSQTPPIEPGVSHDLAVWRAARYSDVRYKLDLTLEKMSPVLKGTIEVRVKVTAPRPADAMQAGSLRSDEVPPIVLDWRKIAGHEKDSTINDVFLNGRPALLANERANHPVGETPTPLLRKEGSFVYDEANEHLVFRDGVVAGENIIKLDFTSPILTSGSAITRYIDKEDGSEYIYSLFVPSDASTAFPVFDQPDLKSRFSLTLKTPDDWTAVTNTSTIRWVNQDVSGPPGNARVIADDHINTVEARETKPISTYVFAFAVGPWEKVPVPPAVAGGLTQPQDTSGSISGRNAAATIDGSKGQLQPPATAGGTDLLSTHFYVRRSQSAKFKPHAAEVFRLNREAIKYLEEYFDYKFPFPKYDIVLIPEFPFGGMEHAGATFLRESSVIFPSEPTANDYISRANLIFHETAHQWFGDTVTMRWFDDLWLKEGFAEFMAYKTLEKTMPQYNAWKAFYERNKPAAYFTDSTRGTTPIYQEIDNLSAAKSAYGNIVYRKAPSFLRQAEFYLGPDKFQTAVRAFLKKHAYANATWQDLVGEFERPEDGAYLKRWATKWVTTAGVPTFRFRVERDSRDSLAYDLHSAYKPSANRQPDKSGNQPDPEQAVQLKYLSEVPIVRKTLVPYLLDDPSDRVDRVTGLNLGDVVFPNYGDYGYGIFLLDDKSRDYVLKNVQNEKDDFLRSMMWGSLWDSVREAELDPREYVELAIKNLPPEKDEMITAAVLGRVSTAMTYYIPGGSDVSVPPAVAGGAVDARPKINADDLDSRLEKLLIEKMRTAPAPGQRITFYRAFLNIASTENARRVLKEMLRTGGNLSGSEGAIQAKSLTGTLPAGRVFAIPLKTKDKFDIVTKLAILNDPEAPQLLAELEKTETSDDAKRYAYAARAAFPTKENREKYWNDFVGNKEISESWIESALGPFNSPRHSELSLPYLERALKELPNLKRNRKIFFVNGWLGAFIGGQKSKQALDMVNNFLADNPSIDRDLRLKILENVDVIERAVKIRAKYP